MLFIGSVRFTFCRIVGVSNIQEHHPVISEYAPNFLEAARYRFNVPIDRLLVPNLPHHSVVSLPIVRGTGDDAIGRATLHQSQGNATIAFENPPFLTRRE